MESEFIRQRAELRAAFAEQTSDLIKWMFIFWSGTVVPIVGMLIAVIVLVK